MRVLLTVPIVKDNLSKSGGANHYMPNLGLAYIAAYLIAKKIEVKIFDGIIDQNYKNLGKLIGEFKPDFIGLTALTSQIFAAYQLADYIKSMLANTKIVIGGPHASALPAETLKDCSSLDYVIVGDGEEVFYRLLVSKNKNLRKIPNLVYRQNKNILINKDKYFQDIHGLPFPAWQLFPLKKYKLPGFRPGCQNSGLKELPVLTARGCPYKCTFCAHGTGEKPRVRQVKDIIAEISFLYGKYQIKAVSFITDTFTFYPEFVRNLCQGLITSGLNKKITWGCATRIDKLNSELIGLMKSAGCVYILIGLESGDQKILNSVKKGLDLKKVPLIVNELKKAGIIIYASFLLGLPGETVQSINKTINYALRLPIDYASFAVFTPFPGTPIFQTISQSRDIWLKTRDWSKFRPQNGEYLLGQKNLTARQIMFLHKKAYFKFYFRKKYLFKLLKIVNPAAIFAYLIKNIKIFKN